LCKTNVYSKNFKYLGREILYQNGKNIQQKLAKFSQILGTLKHHFNQLWYKNFQEANWLSPFLYTEAKFGPLEKRIKKKRLTSMEAKFFRKNSWVNPF